MTADDLQRQLQRVDPRVLLVPSRILRRVIKRDRELTGLGLSVPHRKSYIIARADLLEIASPGELGLSAGQALSETILLFPRPRRVVPDAILLLGYWRLLFHAHVHLAFTARGQLDADLIDQRISRIGETEFREIEAVLHQENLLFPSATKAEIYEEFVAVYLELRAFRPDRLRWYFPGLLDPQLIAVLLAGDIDASAIFQRTRPEGTPDPVRPGHSEEETEEFEPDYLVSENPSTGLLTPDARQFKELSNQADKAAKLGNRVRSLLLRQQAIALAPSGRSHPAREAVYQGARKLANRLQRALDFPTSELPRWTRGLHALVEPAGSGDWSIEARLLYDLQKVCLDRERPIYAVDLVEFFVSWFRRPIQRPLPYQSRVLIVRHLRKALHRLSEARISEESRHDLSKLFHASLARTEEQLRANLQLPLHEALDKVDLAPRNMAERLARDKLIEELLDIVVERGFLSIGQLRDALASNRLKLPDLRGPVEFVTGDPLIRANRQLAWDLDGVYRRGEIYLRWLQRLSSLAFGTVVGRAVTLYAALPLGGAFFTLKGIDGISEEFKKFFGLPQVETFNLWSLGGLTLFYLLLLHLPAFRNAVGQALRQVGNGLWWVVVQLPAAFLRISFIRRILQSWLYLQFYQFLFKPAFFTFPLAALLLLFGVNPLVNAVITTGAFILMVVAVNSWLGLYLEEIWTDRLLRGWNLLREEILPGLFHWVMFISRTALDRVERFLYAVDEWLRFREGESKGAFYLKLVLGFIWFWITYVIRFVVNLLIEPQINPIKHFPVVTVSHKIMFLAAGPIAEFLAPRLGVSEAQALLLVGSVIGLIPGIFGFLVWELRENWRLYRANQPKLLEPVVVGSHGERVVNLIRPGFHSGTLPRLFARLRHAEGAAFHTAEEDLHHVAERLKHFYERDLLAPLRQSQRWGLSGTLAVGTVWLSTNRVRTELCCPALPGESVLLDLENEADHLRAHWVRVGWLAGLEGARKQAFTDALAGFFKLAGVQRVSPDQEGSFAGLLITWDGWVQVWEKDQSGLGDKAAVLVPGLVLLP